MKQIYIAGKFTAATPAEVDVNIARATYWGLVVSLLGGAPCIPHANTGHPAFRQVQSPEFWYEATMRAMRTCDGVLFTPGWRFSSGSLNERRGANGIGLRTWDLDLPPIVGNNTLVGELISLAWHLSGKDYTRDQIREVLRYAAVLMSEDGRADVGDCKHCGAVAFDVHNLTCENCRRDGFSVTNDALINLAANCGGAP